jgi:two-component system sensor histidine kinase/response regulator
MTEAATAPPDQRALTDETSFARTVAPLGLFLVGFLVLVVIDLFFSGLMRDLDRRIQNEQARVLIGEQIVHDLVRIESSVYKLATTRGARTRTLIARDLREVIDGTRDKLDVLEMGGTVSTVSPLNLRQHDTMVRTLDYTPGEGDVGYVMEVIELRPKLDLVEGQLDRLQDLLLLRDQAWTAGERTAEVATVAAVQEFLRTIPPTFQRMTENANRLFFDGQQRMGDLSLRISAQKARYGWMQALAVASVVLAVLALGYFYAVQTELSNRRLREARLDLERARDAAEAANRTKSVFLANMSHEIRTPMNAIIGMTSLVLDSDLNPKQHHDVHTILNSANALLGLLNDILDFSKIEAEQVQLEKRPFQPDEVVEEVVRTLSETSRRRGVALYYRLDPKLPPTLVGDALRLRQILVNLMGNAFKFTDQGQVRIDAELESEADGLATLRFTVADTGMGIPKDRQGSIFDRFTQVDDTVYRRHGGTGLGLSISQRLAELMDGRIWVDSEPGSGSRFSFTVRLARGPERDHPDLGAPRLLVAGTDHTGLALVAERLTQAGCRTECVFDAAEADRRLKAAAGAGDPYRILVLEKRLCDATTTDILGFLREIPIAPDLALIALSEPDKDETARVADGSHVLCVSEPLIAGDLINHMRDFAAARRQGVAGPQSSAPPRPKVRWRILLVEDNHVNAVIARRVLEKEGHHIDQAGDGVAALAALTETYYDLVLMDVQMPNLDGLTATRMLRALEAGSTPERHEAVPPGLAERLAGRHTPVIAMTANAMAGDRELCLAAGMDDYVTKPFNREEMIETLHRNLAGAKTGAEPEPDPGRDPVHRSQGTDWSGVLPPAVAKTPVILARA